MKVSKKFFGAILVSVLLLSFSAEQAQAGDRSFSSLVKHIQNNYEGKRQGTGGLISFARFMVKVIKPAGVKNFKVVLFRSVDYSRLSTAEDAEFSDFVRRSVSSEWRPLVQYGSRKNKQWTYVYCTEESDDVKFLVVNLQQKNAFVAQFKFSPEKLTAFMNDPKIMGISLKDKTESKEEPPQATTPPPTENK
jgi:hypothetical protein